MYFIFNWEMSKIYSLMITLTLQNMPSLEREKMQNRLQESNLWKYICIGFGGNISLEGILVTLGSISVQP